MKKIYIIIFSSLLGCDDNPKLKEVECEQDGTLEGGEVCYDSPFTFLLANGAPNSNLLLKDWDFDGDLDAALINSNDPTFTLDILSNNGQGFFTPRSTLAFFEPPPQIQSGDFNRDGLPDLLIPDGDLLSILINDGEIFTTRTFFDLGLAPQGLLSVDLDRDGNDDMIFSLPGEITSLRNIGNALFEAPVTITVVGSADRLLAQDLTGDGAPELVAIHQNAGLDPSISIIANIGGVLSVQQTSPINARPIDATIADLNADQRPEVILAEDDGTIQILVNDGKGLFTEDISFSLPVDKDVFVVPQSLTAGDFNGDETIDLALIDVPAGDLYIVQNDEKDGLKTFVKLPIGLSTTLPGRMAAIDLNKDGLTELVTLTTQGLSILFANP